MGLPGGKSAQGRMFGMDPWSFGDGQGDGDSARERKLYGHDNREVGA